MGGAEMEPNSKNFVCVIEKHADGKWSCSIYNNTEEKLLIYSESYSHDDAVIETFRKYNEMEVWF